MDVLRIGIVGFGRIGREHLGWISDCKQCRVVAIADSTPARRDLAKAAGCAVVDDFRLLLDRPDIDAILIATPTSMHYEQAIMALRAGKHVMVEKPVATNYHDALELAEEARARGLTLSVFHNRRWDPDYLAVKDAIAAGVFGKVINIESRLGQWSSCVGPAAREYRPNWRNEGAFGGGGLNDWGSHFVDQIWQAMLPARPVRVFAQLRGNVWSEDCDDFARAIFDFDNGTAALVEINTTTTAPLSRWHIDGSTGSAQSPYSLSFDLNTWADLTFSPADGSSARKLLAKSPRLSETDIWEAFAKSAMEKTTPPVSIDSVLVTMKLLDAIRQSAQTGRVVEDRSFIPSA